MRQYPVIFHHQVINMAVGVAVGAITIPAGARYIMATTVGGENNKLFLQLTPVGAAVANVFPLAYPAGSGSVPMSPPIVPLPPSSAFTTPQLRRDATTAALDYTVWFLQ